MGSELPEQMRPPGLEGAVAVRHSCLPKMHRVVDQDVDAHVLSSRESRCDFQRAQVGEIFRFLKTVPI
jgi:hypothetical protein